MFESRQGHVSVVLEDKLYCLGGDTSAGIETLKSVECFSFLTNKWQRCPDLHCTLLGAKGVFNNLCGNFTFVGVFLMVKVPIN